jgi:predicted deacylase
MKITHLLLILALILCLGAAFILHRMRHTSLTPYAQIERHLLSLNDSRYARVVEIGKSVAGRRMYAVVLSDPDIKKTALSCVMFISGQHGIETTPIYAYLDMIDSLSAARDLSIRKILSREMIVFVPVVNPDGFDDDSRFNRNGADLNRNWGIHGQPENRAVQAFVKRVSPQVLIDEHEGLPCRVEIPRFGSPTQRKLTTELAAAGIRNTHGKYALHASQNSARVDPNLAHRYFARQGICGMLVETPCDDNVESRKQTYENFSMAIIHALASASSNFSTTIRPKPRQPKPILL